MANLFGGRAHSERRDKQRKKGRIGKEGGQNREPIQRL